MSRNPSPFATALAGFVALALAMGIGRFAFTPLLPMMQSEGLLDVAEGGVLASAHFVGYAMGALIAGRLKSASALYASFAIIALSLLAMGLSEDFIIWLAARWCAGIASAFVLVIVASRFIQHLATTGRANLQGWVFAGVGGGIALVGLAALWLTATGITSGVGWLMLAFAMAAGTVLVFAAIGTDLFAAGPLPPAQRPGRSPLNWVLILPYGAMGAGYIIPATYLPVMAREAIASPLVFGWGWPVFGLSALVSTMLAARVGRVFSDRRIWITTQSIMAAGLIAPALWPHLAAILFAGVCVGGTFMVITMAGLREANRLADPADGQRHIAAMTTAFALGQIAAPVLAGWGFEATGSFAMPLMLASVLLAGTLVPMIVRGEPGAIAHK